MKPFFLFVTVFYLSGCAISPDRATHMSSLDLCKILTANLAPTETMALAGQEISSRGESCAKYEQAIQTQQAAQQNAINATMHGIYENQQRAATRPSMIITDCQRSGKNINCLSTW